MDSTRSSRVSPRPLARMMVRIFRNFSRPGFADCTRSSASRKRRSSLLFSRANERIRPGTTPAPDPLETAAKYAAFHAGLAQLYPEPLRTTCVDDTDFSSPGALAISMACKDSNENEELRDCTPECVKYFTDFGGDCELLEEAAKAQVASAYQRGQLTTAETEALFAYYNYFKARRVLNLTDVRSHIARPDSLTRAVRSARPPGTTMQRRRPLLKTLSSTSRSTKTKPKGMVPRSWPNWPTRPRTPVQRTSSRIWWVLTSTVVRALARTHALTRSLPLSLRDLFALQDKCGYNYTAALGSEEALRGAVGASSAVRATALAGVAFFFAALV